MKKLSLLLLLAIGSLAQGYNQTDINMQKLYVLDQLQSLKVNYNNFTQADWQAIQPLYDHVAYLGKITSTDPQYPAAQVELKKIYEFLEPLNKPQPVPGALEKLKAFAKSLDSKPANV